MTDFPLTDRNRVKRLPERGRYDKETIYPIIDEALICHVAFVQDDQPFIIPTLHARQGDNLLLHGATTSRMLKHVEVGGEVCVGFTLVDGIVLARSIFHHSVNYRSVVLFGRGQLITDADAKMSALEAFSERIMPGRWYDARLPNPQEFKATSVACIPIELASAKVRVGPPKDDEEDLSLPVWAGVLPIRQVFGDPVAVPGLRDGIAIPSYMRDYLNRANGGNGRY